MSKNKSRDHSLLIVSAILLVFAVNYISLSIGLVDDIIASIVRPSMLDRLDLAFESDPPDVQYLLRAIKGWDWYIAARAAYRVAELQRNGKLEESDAQLSIATLIEVLHSSGHWWRLGWDAEEPEFEQFRSAGIGAVASFGLLALPSVDNAIISSSPSAREAACWILVTMLTQNTIDRDAVTTDPLWLHIEDLTKDRNRMVRVACERLGEVVR